MAIKTSVSLILLLQPLEMTSERSEEDRGLKKMSFEDRRAFGVHTNLTDIDVIWMSIGRRCS